MSRLFAVAVQGALVMLLLAPSSRAAEHFCTDPATINEWKTMVHQHEGSDDWQRLHAIWLGLCEKVREHTIDPTRAHELFERERRTLIEKERNRLNHPVDLGPA